LLNNRRTSPERIDRFIADSKREERSSWMFRESTVRRNHRVIVNLIAPGIDIDYNHLALIVRSIDAAADLLAIKRLRAPVDFVA
jgi:hypothetical protein